MERTAREYGVGLGETYQVGTADGALAYDVCVCVAGASHATDSGIARSLFVEHGLRTGRLSTNPDAALRAAKLRADLELRRRKLNATS